MSIFTRSIQTPIPTLLPSASSRIYPFGRPGGRLPLHAENERGGPAHKSCRLLSHGGVLLAVLVDFGLAGAPVGVGDGVHDGRDVATAAPPSRLVFFCLSAARLRPVRARNYVLQVVHVAFLHIV